MCLDSQTGASQSSTSRFSFSLPENVRWICCPIDWHCAFDDGQRALSRVSETACQPFSVRLQMLQNFWGGWNGRSRQIYEGKLIFSASSGVPLIRKPSSKHFFPQFPFLWRKIWWQVGWLELHERQKEEYNAKTIARRNLRAYCSSWIDDSYDELKKIPL